MAMKTPIPDDWNGEEYACIKVHWPNSSKWLALLAGLLTTPTRGRWWDERTGSVKDAQRTGLDILDLNSPFSACDGAVEPDSSDFATYESQSGGIVVIEGDDMGQVVTEIKVVDGKLRVYYGHCCYDDIAIDGEFIRGNDGEISIPEYDPPGEGEPLVDVACKRAYTMSTRFVQFAKDAFELYTPVSLWPSATYTNELRDAYPEFDLSNWSCFKLFQAAQVLTALDILEWEQYVTVDDAAELTCLWKKSLASDTYKLSRDEYNAMKSVVGDVTSGGSEVFLKTAFDALNFSNFEYLSAQGIYSTSEDCTCPGSLGYDPEGETLPTPEGYYLSENYASLAHVGGTGEVFYYMPMIIPRNVYGIMMAWDAEAIQYSAGRMNYDQSSKPFPVTRSIWPNTSDNWKDEVVAGKMIVDFAGVEIGQALAASLGYESHNISASVWLPALGDHENAGQLLGACVKISDPTHVATMTQWRWVYKVGG